MPTTRTAVANPDDQGSKSERQVFLFACFTQYTIYLVKRLYLSFSFFNPRTLPPGDSVFQLAVPFYIAITPKAHTSPPPV